jgi:glycosyltransferase involved in cell wall biosynthesis
VFADTDPVIFDAGSVGDVVGAAATIALAAPGMVTAAHLGVLGVGSLCYRERLPDRVPPVRFLVVVPAHNEELVLACTLEAITASMRSRDQLLVVDDRSTDRTGEIALGFGATVLRREPGEPPGRAAARQAALRHARSLEWDAMVMIDADSIVESGFFDACERMLATGAVALQARSEAAIGTRLIDQAALASFAVQGVLMPRGRDALHGLVRLRGTGMVLRRDVIDGFEFRAPASEDLVYALDLCLAGIRIRHVESARLRSQNAGSWRTATEQKMRYEVGRLAAAREFVRPLLASRTFAGLEAAWFLMSPPLANAMAFLLLALVVGLVIGPAWAVGIVVAAIATLSAAIGLAFVQARLHPRVILAVAVAPAYLAWKLLVQVRAMLSLRRGPYEFGATERHT